MRNGSVKTDYVEVFGIRKPVFVVSLQDDTVDDTHYYADFDTAQKTVDLFEQGNYTVDVDGNVEIDQL